MRTCKHCNKSFIKPKRGLQCNTCRNAIGRYGINKLQAEEMLEEQFSECKICGDEISFGIENNKSKSTLAIIEHNHITKKIRGIVCHPCNSNIGYIENKNINLDNLKKYLS